MDFIWVRISRNERCLRRLVVKSNQGARAWSMKIGRPSVAIHKHRELKNTQLSLEHTIEAATTQNKNARHRHLILCQLRISSYNIYRNWHCFGGMLRVCRRYLENIVMLQKSTITPHKFILMHSQPQRRNWIETVINLTIWFVKSR